MPILKIDTNLSDEKVPETFNENATKMIAKALSKPHQVGLVDFSTQDVFRI
jgi:hypothetical protein